jgi:putative DNA primase/helicase
MKPEDLTTEWVPSSDTPPIAENGLNGSGQQHQSEQEHKPPVFSDESLALVFAEEYAARLRYVAKWSRWMLWNGKCWIEDETLAGFNLARSICRMAAAKCNKAKTANMLASAKTVAAVERLAKADRRLAATVDQWDANPWLLNTPDGTVDLHTGERHQSRAFDYITQCAAVAPGGECPLWLRFLARVTDGDRALQDYIQRMLGYALTGLTIEHALFFLAAITRLHQSRLSQHRPPIAIQQNWLDYARLDWLPL